ncbi:hypothetical protein ACFOHQ_10360 [Xanthomonas fragariae]
MKVKADREDDGHLEQSFTDAKGNFHSSIGQDYAFSGTSPPIDLPGISFDGSNIFLEPSKNYCSSNLIAASSERNYVTGENLHLPGTNLPFIMKWEILKHALAAVLIQRSPLHLI